MSALCIEHLNKTYQNKFQALKDVCFHVEEGSFFSLLGPNGAGKSTLLGIVSTLIKKNSGKVKICGYDLDTHEMLAKNSIGLMPQEVNLSVFETVQAILFYVAGFYGVPRRLAKFRVEKYLKHLNLWDKREAQVRTLSGGMKRRLMIARALINEPKLLLLDEPTVGVDIKIRHQIWDFLKELNAQGTTIILTTHYLEEAENLCRDVALIDQGQIKQCGKMADFLKTMQVETYIFYLSEPVNMAPLLSGFSIQWLDEQSVEVVIQKDQTLTEAIAAFDRLGLKIKSVKNKLNRLEELFLRLTDTPLEPVV